MIATLRWVTIFLSVVIAITERSGENLTPLYAATLVLSLNAAVRTFYPVPLQGTLLERYLNITFDVVSLLCAISLTNQWTSPFVLVAIPILIVIGLSSGIVAPIVVTAIITASISALEIAVATERTSNQSMIQNTLVLLVSGVIGAVMRVFAKEAEASSQFVVDEMKRMEKQIPFF